MKKILLIIVLSLMGANAARADLESDIAFFCWGAGMYGASCKCVELMNQKRAIMNQRGASKEQWSDFNIQYQVYMTKVPKDRRCP